MRAQEMIEQCQILLGDPHGDVHTTELLLMHLNSALQYISNQSRSINVIQYHRIIEGQFRYSLPEDFLAEQMVWCRWNSGYQLTRARIPDLEGTATVQGNPYNFDIWGKAVVDKTTDSVVRSVDESGTFYIEPVAGIQIADKVYNLSDDHAASTVQSLNLTKVQGAIGIETNEWTGGERNKVNQNDVIRISSPYTSDHVLSIAPNPSRSDEIGDESLAVFLSKKHYKITQAMLNNQNDILEIDAELESAAQWRTMFQARMAEEGEEANSTMSNLALYKSEYNENIPLVRRRSKEQLNAFKQSVQVRTRRYIASHPQQEFGNVIGRVKII